MSPKFFAVCFTLAILALSYWLNAPYDATTWSVFVVGAIASPIFAFNWLKYILKLQEEYAILLALK